MPHTLRLEAEEIVGTEDHAANDGPLMVGVYAVYSVWGALRS